MNKKNQAILLIEKLYAYGNFYEVRKKCKEELTSANISEAEKTRLHFLLNACGIDKKALLAGFATLLFCVIASVIATRG